jgi:hypothetical protein
MNINKSRGNIVLGIILIIVIASLASLSNRSSAGSQVNGQRAVKQSENYSGPIVEYDASPKISSLTDAGKQTLREAKSNRYNHRAPEPLGDFASVSFEINTHWNIGLPPLPVKESDIIVFGKVVDAQAYLSSDKAGVYSEFTINIEKIFRNTEPPIGDSIVLEREGGLVRFSSGRLLPYKIVGQRLPRSQREYIFFLKRNLEGEDFHIITGYEIFQNRILPLDEPEKFQVFKDMAAEEFLRTVQGAIVDSPRQKGGKDN